MNITSTFPTGTHLYQAIPRRDRAVTRYTYAQAYTPLTKALDSSAFHNRPFLLTLLLGKDYVRDHTEFANTHNSMTKLLEYQQIREAIVLTSDARLKFVISTPRIEALLSEPNNNQPSSVLTDQGKNLFIFLLPFHYSL